MLQMFIACIPPVQIPYNMHSCVYHFHYFHNYCLICYSDLMQSSNLWFYYPKNIQASFDYKYIYYNLTYIAKFPRLQLALNDCIKIVFIKTLSLCLNFVECCNETQATKQWETRVITNQDLKDQKELLIEIYKVFMNVLVMRRPARNQTAGSTTLFKIRSYPGNSPAICSTVSSFLLLRLLERVLQS